MGIVLDDINNSITDARVPLDKDFDDDQLQASSSFSEEERDQQDIKTKMNMRWETAIKKTYPSVSTHVKYSKHIIVWLNHYKGNEKKASD